MKLITREGFYFSGKIKDLLKELAILSKQYETLHALRKKSIQ